MRDSATFVILHPCTHHEAYYQRYEACYSLAYCDTLVQRHEKVSRCCVIAESWSNDLQALDMKLGGMQHLETSINSCLCSPTLHYSTLHDLNVRPATRSNALPKMVQESPPHWPILALSFEFLICFVIELTATRVDIDLVKSQPALALPSIAYDIKENHNEQCQV